MSRVVIIGAPGAGKSSIGQRVARRLGATFIDTDHLVEEMSGKTVAEIFVDDGEAVFRDREAAAVTAALADPDSVVSLGGGSILSEQTREALADESVVWLKVSIGEAAKRVGLGTARPLLLGNVRGTLIKLLDERTPLYEAAATWTVDTDGRSLDDIAEQIEQLLDPATAQGGGANA